MHRKLDENGRIYAVQNILSSLVWQKCYRYLFVGYIGSCVYTEQGAKDSTSVRNWYSYFLCRPFARNSLSLPRGGLEQEAIQSKTQFSVSPLTVPNLGIALTAMPPWHMRAGWGIYPGDNVHHEADTEFGNIAAGIISKLKLAELLKAVIIVTEPCICSKYDKMLHMGKKCYIMHASLLQLLIFL